MIETLLVDDEFWGCQLLMELVDWEQCGFHIAATAHSGQEAYDYIREHHPAVVFSDIRMPGISGIELLQRCSAEMPDCRFIMVSGYSDFEYARAALQYGALDYLLKPVEPDQLTECLSRVRKTMAEAAPAPAGDLQQELERSRRQLKEEFFRGCRGADFKPLDGLSMQEINARCGGSFGSGLCRAVMFTADTSLEAEYIAPMLESLTDTLYSRLQPVCRDMVALRTAHSVLVLVNYEESAKEKVHAHLREVFARFCEEARRKPDCTLTLGVGRLAGSNLSETFLSAIEAIHSRVKLGTGRVIDFSEEVPAEVPVDEFFGAEIRQMLSDCILDRTPRSAREAVSCLSDKCFINGHANPASSIRILREVLHYVYAVPAATRHSVQPPISFDEAWQNLEAFSSWEQIEDYLVTLLESFRSLCREESASSGAAAAVFEYINERFDEEISLNSLSALVHLNPKYVSELFRNTYGFTITSHLIQRRMNEAQRLLSHTDMSVNDVGAKVGIPDPKHFSKLFRKEVGLSPREYRKLYSV